MFRYQGISWTYHDVRDKRFRQLLLLDIWVFPAFAVEPGADLNPELQGES
jgi:hypothetical protein